MKILRKLMTWIRKIFFLKSKVKTILEVDFHFVFTNEIPDILLSDFIYILNEGLIDEAIYFMCPCGCDSKIELNLLKDSSPLWNYNINNQKQITISPSVWRKIGCESHFFIRYGKILWVK